MRKNAQAVTKEPSKETAPPEQGDAKALLKAKMEAEIRTRLDEFARELAAAREARKARH